MVDGLPPPGPGGGPPGRIVIDDVGPCVDGGRHPAKRVVGEPVDVTAVALAEGHDPLWVVVAHRPPGVEHEVGVPMGWANAGLDRWQARFTPEGQGRHSFRVMAWVDDVASWLDGTRRKVAAGQDVSSELLEGAALLRAAADRACVAAASAPVPGPGQTPRPPPEQVSSRLRVVADGLAAGDTALLEGRAADGPGGMLDLARACLPAETATVSPELAVLVERERALCSAWYELFPRSWGPAEGVHGSLDDVIAELGYVADLGFDVLYLPPVHPIGRAHRKGPDNAEVAGPDDVGSPWAIGGPEGGHTAVHPALGSVDDVARLATACADYGMDLALDIALQCSPDHPWVTEHPDWFRHRPDGTIHYAENPPKRYQDIYPLDFGSDDWRGLWSACRDIFLFWAEQGVRVFRVDNPHTKPFTFWAWCIGEVVAVHPDAIFLAEAFTRPEPMHRLATVGFTQSYGYFPWRVTKAELTGYFTEVSTPPSVDRLRPSSWPTTPDILPWHLQDAPREAFAVRLVLAATLSPSYGIYGPAFELGDATPAGNGKEEFGVSEKYQLRWWDRADPASLRGLVASVNRARRDQSALRTLRTLRFHEVDDDQLLAFSKTAHAGPDVDPARSADNTVLVIVNLDPVGWHAGMLHLDLHALGIDPDRPYDAYDLLGGTTYRWEGPSPYVELHPDRSPAHVLRLSQGSPGDRDGPPDLTHSRP